MAVKVRSHRYFFKLRLGASIPRSVGRSVLQKLQKKLQNFTKTLQNITKTLQKLYKPASQGRQIAFRRLLSTRFSLPHSARKVHEPYISHEIAEHWKSLQK